MKIPTLLLTASYISVLAAPAFAGDKKEAPKDVAPVPAAGARAMVALPPVQVPVPPMAPPTPAPEISAMAKTFKGTWKCKGSMMMPNGQSVPMISTVKYTTELDGFWLRSSFVQSGKGGFKFEAVTTFDAASKTWHRMMSSNMGSFETSTSEGGKDGKATWNASSSGPMGVSMGRHYEELAGKEFKMWGEYSMDKGKTWMKAYDSTCTK
jgi:hypothetical protein